MFINFCLVTWFQEKSLTHAYHIYIAKSIKQQQGNNFCSDLKRWTGSTQQLHGDSPSS